MFKKEEAWAGKWGQGLWGVWCRVEVPTAASCLCARVSVPFFMCRRDPEGAGGADRLSVGSGARRLG